jgi:hypothetical protein
MVCICTPVLPSRIALAVAFAALIAAAACSQTRGPRLPPTQAPTPPDPTFDPFRAAVQAYIDQTQPYRREAAEAQERVPGKADATPSSAAALRTRQAVLADALRTKLRPTATQGALFTPATATALKHQLAALFESPRRDLILDDLAEQNTTPPKEPTPTINQPLDALCLLSWLIEALPPLPKQLEYDFVGRTIVLRDIDAGVVVDFLPQALPMDPPEGELPAAAAIIQGGASSPLPMPTIPGATIFALMGDSGSGDLSQQQVADAMTTYFNTARRFPIVLMLGDNLYHDDYENEFLEPYKALLDRGVKFYAALGNHDRDAEQHFKPFNMGDRDHYSFDEGSIRFAVLNTNHPNDREQLKWIDTVFADAGTKWRIAFFHHPLYSSGIHGAEGRDVIRPAFEDALVRNRVQVTFAGHEHLYERVRPQRGIYHFVSGGGGRTLYRVDLNEFDEVGVSEHHFMVAQVSGDTLLFEAISHAQKVIDCGAIYRTDSAAQKPDKAIAAWLRACEAAKPRVITTLQDR